MSRKIICTEVNQKLGLTDVIFQHHILQKNLINKGHKKSEDIILGPIHKKK